MYDIIQQNRRKLSLNTINDKAREYNFTKEQMKTAHDLRKPFSLFKCLSSLIKSCKTFEEFEELRSSILPDVEQTFDYGLALVDRMLTTPKDVALEKELANPAVIYQEIIDENIKVNKYEEIDFDYEFKTFSFVQVGKVDLKRIFSNIINNAIEAMNYSGKIILKTKNIKEGNTEFIQFSIKNFGSCIPKEDIKFVFNDNYTKGKVGGHGLGLAIVKQIITENGGEIYCRSKSNKMFSKSFVEFIFTLPSKVRMESLAVLKNLH